MNWAEAGFEAFGVHVLWTDLVGNVAALATVLLAIRKSIWTWPVQLTGSVLLFVASVNAHITGNALKQFMFGALAVYGWWRWTRGTQEGRGLAVRPATTLERFGLVGIMLLGTLAVAVIFFVTKLSWGASIPPPKGYLLVLADAYIFVGSAVATWAQGQALVDFWLIWIAVDLVGVPLAFSSGLVVSGAVYGVFFVLVLVGFFNWLKEYRSRAVLVPEEAV
ncbi:nicotinamide mononucleotide transporter family protein [Streptosporangium sp. NBC_01639]|uniref:nicotinamide mononucleotide transporter family protein n=1 Tax=unclassified Streptosporangium TaxID=2632669 RepID=UPI002DD834B0|nr:nicotinamide mononucleotide transporter family protein [Streptosporangium sp. NBC_01756]WSC85040.1 nicotinamide mononucleotide transporter family protein [Streptosporangium sp. NBC_01756]WTD56320.1 nicotinamide mononucleotide transporter family protein [Streptosporangium sp. NBC_01639]